MLKFSLTDEFNVQVLIYENSSFMVEPENDGSYKIELGKSVMLTCAVVSIAQPQQIWSKRTYQGYEAVESQEFKPEFTSSGFGWTSTITIPQFDYTDSGNYSCTGTDGNNHSVDYVTICTHGK